MELDTFKKINDGSYTFKEIWNIYDKQFDEIRNIILQLGDKYHTESFTNTEEELITLQEPYSSNQLFVYVNGVLQRKDIDYEEVDAYTIRILRDITLDDEIRCITIKTNIIGELSNEYLLELQEINKKAVELLDKASLIQNQFTEYETRLDQKRELYLSMNDGAKALQEIKEAVTQLEAYKASVKDVMDTFGTKIEETSKILSSLEDIKTKVNALDTEVKSKVSEVTETTNTTIDDMKQKLQEKQEEVTTKMNELTQQVGINVEQIVNNVLDTKVTDAITNKLNGAIDKDGGTITGTLAMQGTITPIQGQENTPSSLSGITLKAVTTTNNAPITGIVVEYGQDTNNRTQLLIGDNPSKGLFLGGWVDGSRQEWKQLVTKDEAPTVTENSIAFGNIKLQIEG